MNSVQTRSVILDEASITRKIRRMALEVAEQNIGEKELLLAGIVGNGVIVAKSIAKELEQLGVQVKVITIQLDKKNPEVVALNPTTSIEGKIVIITDDVANTGKTMFYALKPFLESFPKKIQTLALVERSHKEFPIYTDYKGLSIATTLQEHIVVETKGDVIAGAWLY